MDTLVNVLPVALLLGGGTLLYTQCIAKGAKKQETPASKSVQKGGKSNTRASKQPKQSTSDDEVDLNDFMTAKQRKDLDNKKKTQQQQVKIVEQLRQERETLEKAEKAEKAKKAAEKAALDALSPKQRKAALAAAKNGGSATSADQKKQDKDAIKAKQKAEQKKREAEMALKLGLDINGKVVSPKQQPKKVESSEDEDDGFKMATTKKQRQKEAQKLQKQYEREEAAAIASGTITSTYTPVEDLHSNEENQEKSEKVEKITTMVPIPFEDRFKVIGKGAETIELIKQKTDCFISVPQEDKRDFAQLYNNAPVYVRVNGPKEGAALARKIILELAQSGHSPTLNGLSGLAESKFKVEVKQRAQVLGPNGSWLKALQTALDVKIIMPLRSSLDTEITITGPKSGITKCKKALAQLLQEGYCSITHPGWVKSKLPVDSSLHRRLIGRQGQTIRQIQNDNNCKVTFPRTADGHSEDFIFVIGTPENVANATVVIDDLVEEFQVDEEQKQYKKDHADDNDYEDELDEESRQYLYIPDEY